MSIPHKIVFVGDDVRLTQGLTQTTLRDTDNHERGFDVTSCASLSEVLNSIREITPDAIVLGLSDAESREALTEFRQMDADVPIIVLTDDASTCYLEAGAQDCLPYTELSPHLLSRSLGYVLARRRAEEERRNQTKKAALNSTLANLAKNLIAPSGSLERISTLILEKACEITGSGMGFAGYIDPETEALVFSAITPEMGKAHVLFSRKYAQLWGWVLRNQRPLRTNQVTRDTRFDFPETSPELQRFLAVPACAGAELIGEITLTQKETAYTEADQETLERLSSLYALALQRYRAEKALQHYAQEQAALYNISSHIAALDGPRETFNDILETVLGVLKAQAGWISEPSNDTDQEPKLIAWKGVTEAILRTENQGLTPRCPIYRALAQDRTFRQHFVMHCPYVYQGKEGLEVHRHICIPLIAGGDVFGVLTILWYTSEDVPTFGKFFYKAIGQQIGVALYKARLYQAARQVDQLSLLNKLDTALTATLDPEQVVEEALRQLTTLMDAPGGTLVLCDHYSEDCLTRRYEVSGDQMQVLESYDPAQHLRDTFPELPRAAQERPHLIQELAQVRPALQKCGEEDALLVPLRNEGEPLGALLLDGRGNEYPYTDEDRALLQASVNRVAQSLRNAHLYADLKRLLRQREQTQAQLVQTEKMAALGRLVASLAHEINNPLQAIQGCLTLANEDLGHPEEQIQITDLKEYVHIAESEILRITDILTRMRNFYRPTYSERHPADVHDVLESVLGLANKQLQYSEVKIKQDWSKSLPNPKIDSNHLKQVLLNILLNSIDAMPNGGILTIHTSTDRVRLTENISDIVRIEFSDTGVGISPEEQSRIFEPFFTTKRRGSGLGLSISYGIIKEHGGDIQVQSQPGEGTTFSILLPIETGQQISDRET
jgi:signal transduction histidine kinase/DNA-binding NarL/FixJ family response regulator